MKKELQNLLQLEDQRQIRALLALASGSKTTDALMSVLLKYKEKQSWELFGFVDDDKVVGLIGLELLEGDTVEIRHVAVSPDFQNKGLGSQLIKASQKHYGLTKIMAETDSDAEGFYREVEFQLVDTFTNKFGVLRYKFEKTFPISQLPKVEKQSVGYL